MSDKNTAHGEDWVHLKMPGLEQVLEFVPHKRKRVREESNDKEEEIRDTMAREEFLTLFQELMVENEDFDDEQYIRLMKFIPTSAEYNGLKRILEEKKERIEQERGYNNCRIERFLLNFAWIVFFLNIYSSLFVNQNMTPSF